MPSLTEDLITVTYPDLVRRVVEMHFGADEYSRALNVTLSSLYSDDAPEYIADVLGQRCLTYLDFSEEYERYMLVYHVVARYMSNVHRHHRPRFTGQMTGIRDMTIGHDSLTFVLQHITLME